MVSKGYLIKTVKKKSYGICQKDSGVSLKKLPLAKSGYLRITINNDSGLNLLWNKIIYECI